MSPTPRCCWWLKVIFTMQYTADIKLSYCCISVQIWIFRLSQQDDDKPGGFRASCELQIRCHSETFLVLSLKSNRVSRKMASVSSERAFVLGLGRDLCQQCLNVWIWARKDTLKISFATNLQACKLHLSHKSRQVSKKREVSWSPASARSVRESFHVFLTKILQQLKPLYFVYLADWRTLIIW